MGIPALLCFSALCATARCDDLRFQISGSAPPDTKVELRLQLRSTNPVCFTAQDISVDFTESASNGRYALSARWDPLFCGYRAGEGTLSFTTSLGTYRMPVTFGETASGYADLHELSSLQCGVDPDFGLFGCVPLHEDGSSLIGDYVYLAPRKSNENYALNVLVFTRGVPELASDY